MLRQEGKIKAYFAVNMPNRITGAYQGSIKYSILYFSSQCLIQKATFQRFTKSSRVLNYAHNEYYPFKSKFLNPLGVLNFPINKVYMFSPYKLTQNNSVTCSLLN